MQEYPLYREGQKVAAVQDLVNDGSYPLQPADALLVSNGECGEILQAGRHVESGTFVYMVVFSKQQVVGCLEHELAPCSRNGDNE